MIHDEFVYDRIAQDNINVATALCIVMISYHSTMVGSATDDVYVYIIDTSQRAIKEQCPHRIRQLREGERFASKP